LNTELLTFDTEYDTEQFNNLIIDAIQDVKGKNIVVLDLRKVGDAPADFFIICEGDSTTQVSAIADRISRRAREDANTKPRHIEGKDSNRWILVDFFTTMVHVFHPETRMFYELEELWNDAEKAIIPNIN
jgi:ribosome-associated protein